jgi:hypothetical protein
VAQAKSIALQYPIEFWSTTFFARFSNASFINRGNLVGGQTTPQMLLNRIHAINLKPVGVVILGGNDIAGHWSLPPEIDQHTYGRIG